MPGTGWLDDEESRAWRGFMRMHAALSSELARRLSSDSSLSYPDYEVLVALTDAQEARLRMSELAEVLGWEKSRLSHHVSRMERRGLVRKEPYPTDRRGSVVSLTSVGRRQIEEAAPDHVAAVRELFINLLSRSQLVTMAEIAEAVIAPLSGPSAPPESPTAPPEPSSDPPLHPPPASPSEP